METNWPKISVVTPVFNARPYIEDAIQSVLGQNYPNLEYIIMDGNSTDGTVEIIKKYEEHITYWESTPDRGQTHALNKGFAKATGVLRGWLNGDEEYLPGTLRCVGEEYMASKDLDLIYGDRYFLNLEGTHPSKTLQRVPPIAPFPLSFYTGGLLFTDATFWTKAIHDRLGELNEEDYARYGMDVEWLLRVTGIAARWKYIDRPLSIFKYDGMSITCEGVKKGIRWNEKVRREYAKANNISVINIAIGWLWYSAQRRLLRDGILGLLKPPKWTTIQYLFLHKYKEQLKGK